MDDTLENHPTDEEIDALFVRLKRLAKRSGLTNDGFAEFARLDYSEMHALRLDYPMHRSPTSFAHLRERLDEYEATLADTDGK